MVGTLAAELARGVPGLHRARPAADGSRAERAGADAVTIGDTISIADRPRTGPETRRLLAHELVHVAQQTLPGRRPSPAGQQGTDQAPADQEPAEEEAQRLGPDLAAGLTTAPRQRVPFGVLQRGDDDVCLPPDPDAPRATFVLDPALGAVDVPDHVTLQVRIAAAGTGADRYLELDRPVLDATRIAVFAVPRWAVYDDPAAAAEATGSDPTRSVELVVGQRVWTAGGAFTVTGLTQDAVLAGEPTPDAVAATAVVAVQLPDSLLLVDAGTQGADEALADAMAREVAFRLGAVCGAGPLVVDEAVLLPGAPQGHLLPQLARYVAVGRVRATFDDTDGRDSRTLAAVTQAQAAFREGLVGELRAGLTAGRDAWEATQPLALTRAGREERWERHLEHEVAVAIGALPQTTPAGLTETWPGVAGPDAAAPSGSAAEAASGAGAGEAEVLDLTDLEWQAAPDGVLALQDGDRLHLLNASAVLLVPRPRPLGDVTAPGLRRSGPTGPAPVGSRAPTPWLGTPAIGKGAFVVARTRLGLGFVVDAGGSPRLLTGEVLRTFIVGMGVSSLDGALVTHGHADHVSRVLDVIAAHDIRAERLLLSRSWVGMRGPLGDVVDALRTTTDARLRGLGYGPAWEPGLAMEGTGVTEVPVRVGGREVRVLARGEVQQDFREGGHPRHRIDSASLLYLFGNETSGHRTLVLGDVRGGDISAFHDEMGAERFRAAMRGVRVVVGFGHHFSDVAGKERSSRGGADVAGLELLFKELVVQNGELTIVIQSTEQFSFGADPASARARALLDFCTRLGARVVFADRPAAGSTGTGLLQSDLGLGLSGTGVTQHTAEPRVAAALERLQVLREARRTLAEDPELGRRSLRSTTPAAELVTGLDGEIARLEAVLHDLVGRAAADLYDQRGEATEAARQAFRAERERSGRSLEQLDAELARRGPIEAAIPADVERGLRAAVRHGSTLSVEAELLSTPRAATEAVAELPPARRRAIEEQYRALEEVGGDLAGEHVPAGRRAEIMAQVQLLRAELLAAGVELPAERRGAVEAELRRFDGVLDALGEGAEVHEVQRRAADGTISRTEYRLVPRQDAVDRAFGRVGQGFGAMMISHSFHGLAGAAQGLATGQQTVPEALLRGVHDAWGLHAGVRMLRVQHVGMGEFVAMAVIEFGAVLAADHASTEQRDFLLARTALHSTVNLLCMRLGMGITAWGSRLPHPWAKGAVMGLGLAVTLGGEWALRKLDLDDDLERWTAFAPSEVTEVHQRIDATLGEYRMALGAEALARRDLDSLGAAGAGSPSRLRAAAGRAVESHRTRARQRESQLMTLFEDAYDRARTSYVGLQALDALASQFAALRHAALGNDPAHDALQRRFLELDDRLGLDGMSPTAVRAMEQWSELDGKLSELSGTLSETSPDWQDLFEELDECQQMLANARYRIDPARAGYRGQPLISPRSPAWGAYTERLATADRRLAALLARIARLSGVPASPAGVDGARFAGLATAEVDPRASLGRLQSMREAYDDRVHEAVAAVPELAAQGTWADPTTLAGRSAAAHRDHPGTFHRLRLAELGLRLAIGQARSAARTASGVEDAVAALIQRETRAAEEAITARRETHGVLLPDEVDAELTTRRGLEAMRLAVELDQAFPGAAGPAAGSPGREELTAEELEVLHRGDLSGWGGRISTTQAQLDAAWERLAPMRSQALTDPMPDPFADDYLAQWNALDRPERRLARVVGPTFWTLDTDWIDTTDEHTLRAGEVLVVVPILADTELAPKHWYSFSSTFVRAIPISRDAVARFGRRPVYLAGGDLRYLRPEELGAERPAARATVP